jgi:hypothetical protein
MRRHVQRNWCQSAITKGPISRTSKHHHEQGYYCQRDHQYMGKGFLLLARSFETQNEANTLHTVDGNGYDIQQSTPFDLVNGIIVWCVSRK